MGPTPWRCSVFRSKRCSRRANLEAEQRRAALHDLVAGDGFAGVRRLPIANRNRLENDAVDGEKLGRDAQRFVAFTIENVKAVGVANRETRVACNRRADFFERKLSSRGGSC